MVYLTKCKQHHYYQPIILALGMGIGVGFLMDTIAFRVIGKVGIFPGGDGSIIPAGIFSLAVSIIISLLIIKVLDTLSTIGDD